ncbi:hypothetical protein WR25_18856 isoform A [Diploscapter pachys]|uniref:SCP domain-containing protein n=1 Tax=Diploscapter pachys TaxID=2018661 RepID=A0A2A2KAM1_9BILA|nr:hypothetical protein WR25_18856 isoform A [Diploscapter pachys]
MKRFFSRKKLRKSKSDCSDRVEQIQKGKTGNGTTPVDIPQSKSITITNNVNNYACDWDAACSTQTEERSSKNFDSELDKHMMQTITDVKYLLNRSKYTALNEVNFQRGCLDAHNQIRQRYGSQCLSWSSELADLAHAWSVRIAERGRILYPELPGIGDNIHLVQANAAEHLPTGVEIVDEWEKEAAFFDFSKPRWHPKSQRFSQMVWRDSLELGAARYWNTENNMVAVVCFYRPAGNSNAPGEFATNVPSRPHSLSPARTLSTSLNRKLTFADQKK